MNIHYSQRTESFGANIFNILEDKRRELAQRGARVYNLSVGTPDFPPDGHVMAAVSAAALRPDCYKYSLGDMPELISAVQGWYSRRYGVSLQSDEIMSVYGSQEGIAHIALALCDPGELVLVPNPCYPIFKVGPQYSGAKTVYYPLERENGYLPDLTAIPDELADRARAMIVSYPSNPVCATAPDSFYKELIAFAAAHDITIIHDNAYSEIIFDRDGGGSFLSFEGAREVGVEFNSLSKSYNLSGLRTSFLLGNSGIIERFRKLRSQIDYGSSYLSQIAAIEALNGPQEGVRLRREEYRRRMTALADGLTSIGWSVPHAAGTMFLWAAIPESFESSEKFCLELLERTGVICTPGSSFGTLGEGYVRFALILPTEEIESAVRAIAESGIIKK